MLRSQKLLRRRINSVIKAGLTGVIDMAVPDKGLYKVIICGSIVCIGIACRLECLGFGTVFAVKTELADYRAPGSPL